MTPPTTQNGPLRHFLQFKDFSSAEIAYVLDRARLIKDKFKRYEPHMPLHDRTLAMVFEGQHAHPRVVRGRHVPDGRLGHQPDVQRLPAGPPEPIEDTARVISRMVDIVMIRTFEQTRIERFASHSRVPVINGLTNEFHPARSWPTSSPTSSIAAPSPARRWPGWATPTTWPTPGCRPPSCWASRCTCPARPATSWNRRASAIRPTRCCISSRIPWRPARARTW